MFSSIRVKLTLWYIGVLAMIVGAFALVTYSLFVSVLKEETDENLTEMARTLAASVKGEKSDGDIERSRDDLVKEAVDEIRFRDYKFAVFTDDGRLISKTTEKEFPSDLDKVMDQARLGNVSLNAEPFRVFLLHFRIDQYNYKLYTLHSLGDEIAVEARIRNIFFIIVPLMLLLAGVGGYFLARETLKPIADLSERTKRISSANLHERLPIANAKDEIGNLAIVFNELLDRLDVEFERQQRFIADASHELRTPLSIIRGESEVALLKESRTSEDYQESLRIVNDEGKRLTKIVEDLFTLARADSGELKANLRELYLDELVADCVTSIRTLADKRNIGIEFEGEETQVKGDETLLRRLFLNLIDNAVKYNIDNGKIRINVADKTIAIANTGEEIPREKQSLIFDRFYRADKLNLYQHSSLTSGAGLGLSIAKTIAVLHHAELIYSRSKEGENIFTVIFPR